MIDMDETKSREKILKKVRKALIQKSPVELPNDLDFDSDIFSSSEDALELQFAKAHTTLNGKFLFCENEEDFIQNIASLIKENAWENVFCLEDEVKRLLKKALVPFSDNETGNIVNTDIGVTLCECLVARTGSVIVSSRLISGRRLPVYANIHIVVAYTSQLVYNIKDALKLLKNKYGEQLPSMISTITGPSRTADIEKTLVQGAHGPKEIYVCLIDDAQ